MRKFLLLLLLPLGWLYGSVVALLRWLYKIGLFQSHRFPNLLIIKIGNLSVGGTGKTPHTAFFLRLLRSHRAAVVSRGYGRQTKENLFVELSHTPAQAGDEPLMLKNQFPDVPVVVARRRAEGLQLLQKTTPYISVALLDDAMQHWAVEANLTVMLTTFQKPFFQDAPLPAGRLREFSNNYIRANLIIVTQCPPILLPEEADFFKKSINLQKNQNLLFSYYNYDQPYALADVAEILDWKALAQARVLTLLAIAQTDYISQFLEANTADFEILAFRDHHLFQQTDINLAVERFRQGGFDCILTTEKDAVRLRPFLAYFQQHQVAVFVLPVVVQFHFEGEAVIEKILKPYLSTL